jgi:hypothetical protein
MKRVSAREPGRASGRVQRRAIEGEGLGASPGAKQFNALAVDLFPAVADRAKPDPR